MLRNDSTRQGASASALVVVPEPADWHAPLVETLRGFGPVEVFAPWALPRVLAPLGRRVGFVRRRAATTTATGRAWFTAAELLTRALARGRTAATLRNRVHLRALADRATAHHLRRDRSPRLVVAPSLAARRTFAAAHSLGARCLLLEDMPDFDGLVDGLDTLAVHHPHAHFLRNHRPRAQDHARQRAERWQADAIAVRGGVSWHRLGPRTTRVQLPRTRTTAEHTPGPDIAFAGPPLARAGSTALLPLLEALPTCTVRVLPGPRSEPEALLQHPRVRVDASLDGVGVVLSLGPLESHPRAVGEALDRGIPVVGTRASTGLLDPMSVQLVDADDVPSTVAAIERALADGTPPRPWAPATTLHDWLDAQYSVTSNVTA